MKPHEGEGGITPQEVIAPNGKGCATPHAERGKLSALQYVWYPEHEGKYKMHLRICP